MKPKRTLISIQCPSCFKSRTVRKDGAGEKCRSCRAKSNHKLAKPKDILGKKFGRLIVLGISHIHRQAFWICKCQCNNECIVSGNRLRQGKTKSCGCIVKTRKGMSQSLTFHSWRGMIDRCYDKKNISFKRYGEKGIKVCNRWRTSFENFLEDMGIRPNDKTLDRIDNEKGYSPENCRWATNSEQGNNRKNNHLIAFSGKTKTLTEWAHEYGIHWSTLRRRIKELKWPLKKALLTPPRQKKKLKESSKKVILRNCTAVQKTGL